MLIPRRTDTGWELVEADSDDAGTPQTVVASYTGRLAGARVFLIYWGRVVAALLRRR